MTVPGLLDPEHAIDDVVPPLWWAWRGPVPFGGMPTPSSRPEFFKWLAAERGVGAVVSLMGAPPYDCAPLRLSAFGLEDLQGKPHPANPVLEWEAVRDAARGVKQLLDDEVGVVVHCAGGTGRTGTVVGAVLVALGWHPDHVIAWLDRIHRRRGEPGWPESPWQTTALEVLGSRPS